MNSSRRGIALVIAISNYKHQEKLGNAINDANEMTRKLNECNYEVIEAINEEIDGIQSALHKVRIRISVNSYPEVVIYYAGHGLVNDDSLYILGSEYEDGLNQLVLNGLSVEKVIERICEISIAEDKKRSIVVILDTCRKPAAPGPPLRAGQSASSDFVESHARLILKNKTRIGILVCYACAQGRGARDYGNHGLYTKFVLEECFKSNMSIINALGNANEKVYQMTNLSQKPQLAVNFPHYFTFSLGVPQDEEKSEASSNNRVAELSTRLSLQILQEEKLMPPHSSSVDIRSVDIPLVEDMPLEEEWEYISNRNGPAIHAKKDFLLISRSEGTSNQWSYLFLEHAFPVDNWGYTISFDIRYDIIQPETEVKLTLAGDLILRYDGKNLFYCYWNDGFIHLKRSSIVVGDDRYHNIVLSVMPLCVTFCEDGSSFTRWAKATDVSKRPTFHWQILFEKSILQAKMKNFRLRYPALDFSTENFT